MQWSRVKTILIVLLLAANLALLGVYAYSRSRDRQVTDYAVSALVDVLGEMGVTIDKKTVPPDMSRLYVYDVPRDEQLENQIAQKLIGECRTENPGGGIYQYSSDAGRVSFRSAGVLQAVFGVPLSDEEKQTSAQFLAGTLLQTGLGDAIIREDTPAQLHAVQTLSGLEIFNCSLTALFDDAGNLTSLSGRWVTGQPAVSDVSQPKSAAFALIRLTQSRIDALDPIREVTGMQEGYIAVTAAPGIMRFVPVWKVTADGEEIYVNAITGQVESAG